MNKLTDRAEVERLFPGNEKRLADIDNKGSTLVGDVHPESVMPVAGALTPVPGGVGPMTIATLIDQTATAAERLLIAKGAAIEKVRVDLEPERRAEMMKKSGRRTVPQIWIGERHIGGCDDLYALDRQGGLDPLLKAKP